MNLKLTKKTIANCEDPTMKAILQALWDLKKNERDFKKITKNNIIRNDNTGH